MGETVGFNDRYLRVGGLKVHLREGGKGPPLLLVHGLGGPPMWQKVLGPLSKRFRVMAVDLPGFGDSDPLSSRPAMFRTAGPGGDDPSRPDMRDKRDDSAFKGYGEFRFHIIGLTELGRPVVCGISWGGEHAVR